MRYKVALVQRQMNKYEDAIFPEEYYEIPGVQAYQDIDAIREFAWSRIRPYKGETMNLFINGGLAIELLTVIQVAAGFSIHLNVWHRNAKTGDFCMQPVRWKPGSIDGNFSPISFSLSGSRHPGLPERFLFETVQPDQILDFKWQEERAQEVLTPYMGEHIQIYVTGLKPLCVSALNAACRLGIGITWMHYDVDTEEYFAQEMS